MVHVQIASKTIIRANMIPAAAASSVTLQEHADLQMHPKVRQKINMAISVYCFYSL